MSCNGCTLNNINDNNGCGTNCGARSFGSVKLSVFDWLANTQLPGGQEFFDCVEVRFKNSRKEYFRNVDKLPLQMGDVVATEASSGHDVGVVSLTGELVRSQMKKRRVSWEQEDLPRVYRKANQHDIDVWQQSRDKEIEVQKQSRELAIALGLEMKISDVEFQGDGSKATFYYTAEGRVDFRQLIKDMARAFSVRIEMRQIGFRQEAARLGGIGSCGRELCCATWLTDFRSVSTSAARYQQLSLNPQKLAGQCGKLKCCLNFELDTYLDALQDFPRTDVKLQTLRGTASCQKIDIFKRLMWFTYDENPAAWYKLSVDSVKEIIGLNKGGEQIEELEEYAILSDLSSRKGGSSDMELAPVEEDSITRFDTPKRKRSKRNNKKGNNEKEALPKEAVQEKEAAKEKTDAKPERNNKNNRKLPKNVNKAAELKRTGEGVLNVATKEVKLPIEAPQATTTPQQTKKIPAPEANNNHKRMQQKQKMSAKKQQNPNARRNLDPFANKVNKPKQSNNEKSE